MSGAEVVVQGARDAGPAEGSRRYESDLATVVLGDARDVLASIGTESVDLVLTDPPYGVEWRSNMRTEKFDELDNDGACDRGVVHEVLRHCVRIVGQKRHLYVFGPADVLAGLKVSAPAELVWDKGRSGMGDLSLPWGPAHEPISFVVSLHRHGGKAGWENMLPVRMRKGSVLAGFAPPTGRSVRHPSEKPVGLLRELVESSSRQGDLVVDPFAGSGSTGVAAVLSGRRCLLVESDPRWFEMAVSRVRAAEDLMRQARSI